MRLITRADLDGLTCSVIITSHEDIAEILLIHPQAITDRAVDVTKNDILANVPYHLNCAKWFDHHLLTSTNRKPPEKFEGSFGYAPSAAELVWKYYGQDPRFEKLVAETSRFDAARLTKEDVLDPHGYILLGYTLDSRTGIGAFEEYFHKCREWLKTMPIEEIMDQPEVRERTELLQEEEEAFQDTLKANTRLDANVVITDFRAYDFPPIGNRFLVYVLYPESNVSLRLHWGPEKKFVVAAAGHSIFNRTCKTNIGVLMSKYGGGGHVGAGSAPLPTREADQKIAEILDALKEAG